ncbi:hypothetical protein BG015_004197 [Linnemannia schmuckeri]|uniref:Uncharacterized protein n=1 Tax=Linnemannia schmuckeri TaxID=64567 RepID=A0A9P5S1X7_9FUNG|nr:hypothetical protein BG015_004197 [Linnemannia schmuckeri]
MWGCRDLQELGLLVDCSGGFFNPPEEEDGGKDVWDVLTAKGWEYGLRQEYYDPDSISAIELCQVLEVLALQNLEKLQILTLNGASFQRTSNITLQFDDEPEAVGINGNK